MCRATQARNKGEERRIARQAPAGGIFSAIYWANKGEGELLALLHWPVSQRARLLAWRPQIHVFYHHKSIHLLPSHIDNNYHHISTPDLLPPHIELACLLLSKNDTTAAQAAPVVVSGVLFLFFVTCGRRWSCWC